MPKSTSSGDATASVTTTKKKTASTAAKTTKAKSKSKAGTAAKTKTKTKTKAKEKKSVAAKKPKKPKKEPTPEEKEKAELRELRKMALLKGPTLLPETDWSVYISSNLPSGEGKLSEKIKEVSASFKTISEAEKEVMPSPCPPFARCCSKYYLSICFKLKRLNLPSIAYLHSLNQRILLTLFRPFLYQNLRSIADANRATNKTTRQNWIESYPPEAIYMANLARRRLARKLEKSRVYVLHDERLPRRAGNSFNLFIKDNFSTANGDSAKDAFRASIEQWKTLSEAEKAPYRDQASVQGEKSTQELKRLRQLGKEYWKTQKAAAKAQSKPADEST